MSALTQLILFDVPPSPTGPARLPRVRRARAVAAAPLPLFPPPAPMIVPAMESMPAPSSVVPPPVEAPWQTAEPAPTAPSLEPAAATEPESSTVGLDEHVEAPTGWRSGELLFVGEETPSPEAQQALLMELRQLLGGRVRGGQLELKRPGAALWAAWSGAALEVRWTGPVAALGWLEQLGSHLRVRGLYELT